MLISLSNISKLPLEIAEAFKLIADEQRGEPELIMSQLQRWCPGTLGYNAEHIGDLSHRMTHAVLYGNFGYEYVNDKVNKCLRSLTQAYGFEKELEENVKSNSRHKQMTETDFRNKLVKAMTAYAIAHSKLPAYNDLQKSARDAAVCLGKQNYEGTILHLRNIQKHLATEKAYNVEAAKYSLINGKLQVL